jgi:DivIVA domain-containing protein
VPQMMMWVFAVLIVLAMGGIALLAAGRGEPMQPAYDDRPDARVPLDRPITADDLRRVRFSLAFRGYRMSEVDALLARLAREQEMLPSQHSEPGRHMASENTDSSGSDATFPVLPPTPPAQ